MPLIVLVVPLGELPAEVVGQRHDVVAPLAEGRQVDRHDLQAEVQVVAELAGRDQLFQGAVGGRDEPHVDLDRLVVADARDLLLLQHAEQLDLRAHRHVADFVEEQRAAVGVLERADPIGVGVGKGPLHVAEQLALDEVLGHGGAVEGDDPLALAGAVLVNGLGDQLLAGAAFAVDQHGGVGRGDPLQPVDHRLHLAAGVDDPLEAEPLVEPLAELGVLPLEADRVGCLLADRPQAVRA